jgi:uncharacterized damage-inducible protein DinB
MLHDCIRKCPGEQWDGIVAKYPFWQVAYHTLCFADLYLTESEEAFEFRDIHPKGWAEFNDEYPSRRFEKAELADYLACCREKAIAVIGAESEESLKGPSGFARHRVSRAEIHIYNIRHIQHHVGQLGAYLRRIDQKIDPAWIGYGWRCPRT